MRGEGSLYPRGKVFWVSYYHDGQTHRESTGKTNESDAKKYLKNLRDELGAARIGARTFTSAKSSRLRVRELVDALEADFTLRGKLSPQNKSHLHRVKNDFGHYRAVDLKPAHIDKYINERLAAGAAHATVNRCTQLLGQCFALATKQGQLAQAPYIRQLTEDNIREDCFTEEEFGKVVESLPQDLRDFVRFAAACGVRKGELSAYRWDMLKGETLHVPARIRRDVALSLHH